ncbi:hypothetical protein HJC23_010987 [Cyclotella cryptica]|uniref:Uncharacterized protein n=1 Tax=Cyclotella cryptica TaxID=29204 RepID=A0ABD3PZC7_9STRA|eukprot:CCRYP_010279-RA/>CCRYP_010279-RA protein AED:0.00 eAED:0.00 QI:244/-1/1/1/-1/1/1/39/165
MQNKDDSSSDDERRPPSNVLYSGWAGDFLEIEHQRETAGGRDRSKSHTAVDLSQFRNEEVGKGYQAKHVVRQREAIAETSGVVDMSGGAFSSRNKSDQSLRRSSHEKGDKSLKRSSHEKKSAKRKHDDDRDINAKRDSRLESYLKCKGLKAFLGEIDKIISKEAR